MKHILACLIVLAPLGACSTIPAGGSIEQVNKATLKAGIVLARAYETTSKFGQRLVERGVLDKARYKALDAKAFGILMDFRAGKLLADVALAQINAIGLEMAK